MIFAFPPQLWLQERTSTLRYTYIVHRVQMIQMDVLIKGLMTLFTFFLIIPELMRV